jgi:hypothetical protein
MAKKSILEEPVTESDKPKPITMIPMPENLAEMSDEEIDAFASKIWDGWIEDNPVESNNDDAD